MMFDDDWDDDSWDIDEEYDDDSIHSMSLKEINEYIEKRYNKCTTKDAVQEYAKHLDDTTAVQMLASYIMQYKTCAGFITSKEDLVERVTELINDNFYSINRRLTC